MGILLSAHASPKRTGLIDSVVENKAALVKLDAELKEAEKTINAESRDSAWASDGRASMDIVFASWTDPTAAATQQKEISDTHT